MTSQKPWRPSVTSSADAALSRGAARAIGMHVSHAHHWILKEHSRRAVQALGFAVEAIRDGAGMKRSLGDGSKVSL